MIPRYKGGNMTGAVDKIEKIKKGLSAPRSSKGTTGGKREQESHTNLLLKKLNRNPKWRSK